MDTRDELKQYEVMSKVKRNAITVQLIKAEYYEVELENITEEEAIRSAKEQVSDGTLEPYDTDIEISDHWVNRL